MTFSHFDARFRYNDGLLTVKDARTYGNVLSIKSNGVYNLHDENLNFGGTLALAYGLNTLIGRIPLIGNLLVGTDGTVFVADYSITGTALNPDIRLNPLSALPPNALKEVVSSMFGKDKND
jgi:hypothetical protein